MASKKIDELTNLTSLASDDLLVAYDISEPGGEKTKKISKTNAFTGLSVDGHTHSAYLLLAGGNISGDLTVGGNLTVTGTQFIADVQTVEVTDNLMLLNKNETGPGVTAGTAGLEIERGTATNYKFIFDEPTDTFRVGMDGSLQPVATREDSPISSGIAIWNNTLKRFDTMASINGMEAHGNEYHTSTFITSSALSGYATEIYVDTVSGVLNTKIGLKEDAFSKNTAFNKNFGTALGDVCQGNDARLSDARTPTSHNHDDLYYTETEVNNGQLDSRYYTETEVDTISGALNTAKLDLAGGNISGNLTVGGDFTVQGENFIANTQTVLVEDNLLVINKNEVGAGVTAGEAGIEVERGSEANYQFLFNETQDNFRVGISGSLQAVATRQDIPTQSGVAFWNDTDKRLDTVSGFTVNDVATKDYLSSVFSNKYEVFTTSGTDTVTINFDLAEGAMGVYVDGVRQHASSFTFSSPRTIILSDTVASGTAIAVIAMEADSVQNLAAKANTTSPVFTGVVDVNGQLLIRNGVASYDSYNYGSSFTVEDIFFGNGNGRLAANGRVGIGNTNPNKLLEVNTVHTQDINDEIRIGSYFSSNFYGLGLNYIINSAGTPSQHIVSYSAGTKYTHITLTAGTNTVLMPSLAGSGNRVVYSDGSGLLTNSASDFTLKTNIESINYGLAEVLEMNPIMFQWIDTEKMGAQKEVGFIAQEMEEIIPEVVGTNSDGLKSLDYPKLTAVLCNAIKELSNKNNVLEARLAALEAKLA
jgi:hypothetical protein